METSLKPGFAQIFSCCPKLGGGGGGGGGGAPPPPPPPIQILGNSDFLGSTRKFGQSQFLKTSACFC